MRILLTGATGFIGHYILENILNTEPTWDVVCLERLSYSGNLNRIRDFNLSRVKVLCHDLRCSIGDVLAHQLGQFDYIVHVAANSHVDRSIEDPLNFVMDNVVGTCNILNFARRQQNLKKFVYFSTDEVYGPAESGQVFSEYDRYNSTNPYSASKAGGEELAVAFRNTYGIPVVVTHAMNVFGIRQHPEKFVPKCIRKIINNETLHIHGNADMKESGSRHYIHGKDVADAVRFILDIDDSRDTICPKYNISSDEEISNLEMARLISNELGKELKYSIFSDRPGCDFRYSISGEKLRRLGWSPKISVKTSLREVIQWTLMHTEWI